MKHLSKDIWCPSADSNRVPPVQKSEAFPFGKKYSVVFLQGLTINHLIKKFTVIKKETKFHYSFSNSHI
jgi:hypothetical protein